MPKGKKTTPEMIYEIMATWAITRNYMETARRMGMATSTIKKIVDENINDEKFQKMCGKKEQEFAEKAGRIINKALNRLEGDIDDEHKDIPVNHLTTVIGTLYDKKALAEGEATENVAVEIKLPPGVEDYAG